MPTSRNVYFAFASNEDKYPSDPNPSQGPRVDVLVIFEDGMKQTLKYDQANWKMNVVKIRIPESKMGMGFQVRIIKL